jgi:hypothetical protein
MATAYYANVENNVVVSPETQHYISLYGIATHGVGASGDTIRKNYVVRFAGSIQVTGRGETFACAAAGVGCSARSIQRWQRRSGGPQARRTPRAAVRLSLAEREEISRSLRGGES